MKKLTAYLLAAAIVIAPAQAEQKQKQPCPQEASLVIEGLIMAWMITMATYFIGSAYHSYKEYERAREQNGGVPVEQICEWRAKKK